MTFPRTRLGARTAKRKLGTRGHCRRPSSKRVFKTNGPLVRWSLVFPTGNLAPGVIKNKIKD